MGGPRETVRLVLRLPAKLRLLRDRCPNAAIPEHGRSPVLQPFRTPRHSSGETKRDCESVQREEMMRCVNSARALEQCMSRSGLKARAVVNGMSFGRSRRHWQGTLQRPAKLEHDAFVQRPARSGSTPSSASRYVGRGYVGRGSCEDAIVDTREMILDHLPPDRGAEKLDRRPSFEGQRRGN